MKKPTAILTSDIHIRDDQPVCRLDNFWETAQRKIQWLKDLQRELGGPPIFDSGDLFHHWKATPYLLQWAIEHLPKYIYTVPGNHDLPAHNLDLYDKSGLCVLEAAGAVNVIHQRTHLSASRCVLHPFPWGIPSTPLENKQEGGFLDVAICHTMTFSGRKPWPGCTDPGAGTLLKKLTGYDLIVTGHYHKSFEVSEGNRRLVNPGGLFRMSADEADRKPVVYLWYAEDNSIQPVFVPVEEGVISREHIATKENRDARIDAFVSRLSGDFEVGLSFQKNLAQFFSVNEIKKPVQDLVWECVGGE